MAKQKVLISLSEETNNYLDEMARKNDISKSEIVELSVQLARANGLVIEKTVSYKSKLTDTSTGNVVDLEPEVFTTSVQMGGE